MIKKRDIQIYNDEIVIKNIDTKRSFTHTFDTELNNIKKLTYAASEPILPDTSLFIAPKKGLSAPDLIKHLKDDGWCFSDNDNESECIEMLNDVNFYTLSYYGRKENDKSFDHIKNIYYFDDYLRNWLMKITTNIEFMFRTKLINAISEQSDSNDIINDKIPSAFRYLDKNIYLNGYTSKKLKKHLDLYHSTLVGFQEIIEREQQRDPGFKHDLDKYGAVAIWTLLNKTTLGTTVFMYRALNTKYKKKVVNEFLTHNVFNLHLTPELLDSWLENLNYIRNMAAHSKKIYHEPLIKIPKQYKDIPENDILNDRNRDKIIASLLVFRRFYMLMSSQKQSHWNRAIDTFFYETRKKLDVSSHILGFDENTGTLLKIEPPSK
jgi:abortive infection bacteriophage resistance protein